MTNWALIVLIAIFVYLHLNLRVSNLFNNGSVRLFIDLPFNNHEEVSRTKSSGKNSRL